MSLSFDASLEEREGREGGRSGFVLRSLMLDVLAPDDFVVAAAEDSSLTTSAELCLALTPLVSQEVVADLLRDTDPDDDDSWKLEDLGLCCLAPVEEKFGLCKFSLVFVHIHGTHLNSPR